MYLTGLTHRDELFDLACRWLGDRNQPQDGRVVTEIFVFERIITAPTVRSLVADLIHGLQPGPFRLDRVQTKDAVREAIAALSERSSPRVRELVEHYRELSEEYFPRTPVCLSMVTNSEGRPLAMIRRKRVRRIAEKVSRNVADQLATAIDETARQLAAQRAWYTGVNPDDLVSDPEVMASEFTTAERVIADRFRSGDIVLDREAQRLDDVVGVKLIGSLIDLERVERILAERPGTEVVEREVHRGTYSGIHLLVDLDLPPVNEVVDRMHGTDWSFAAGRGLSPNDLETEFADYVERGARSFRIELILTTFEDLVESELGSSIHEAMILAQRQRVRYTGRIARNASFIVEYLLRLALSPTVHVDGLPVKMWGRYLPDTLAHAVGRLAARESPEWLLPPDDIPDLLPGCGREIGKPTGDSQQSTANPSSRSAER